MLRNSKFVQLGDFNGRMVFGEIVNRVNDDFYIDFGLKFPAVCKRPQLALLKEEALKKTREKGKNVKPFKPIKP